MTSSENFELEQIKLILCFASQDKIHHPQPGLFLVIKVTRQGIHDGQNKETNGSTKIDRLRHSQTPKKSNQTSDDTSLLLSGSAYNLIHVLISKLLKKSHKLH